ncbi:MAG: NAD-dependent epimerase/dehydratase family protein [Candidatus Aenigmarchaeota archaeon]|nr:NAD-dependent epimerase/dehydratase family protein [Candidatus Aenigmarchaeota archaeon]
MKIMVTGGAGCIGSELVGKLLKEENNVTVYDNLSSGKIEHISPYKSDKNFAFIKADLLNKKTLMDAMKGYDIVFHLAANPDIKFLPGDVTDNDLKQNTIATYNVLEAMRINNIKKIVFSSTSAVYGEAKIIPTKEDYAPLIPISLYGASKLACEGLISAFAGMFDMQAWIFRFANIVGSKSRKIGTTVISDFINKLKRNPKELEILGNGKQRKSYLLLEDCIDGMLFGLTKAKERVNILNLSAGDNVSVNEIASMIIAEMGPKNVKIKYTGGDRGWLGDVPVTLLSAEKIKKLGWVAKYNSKGAVELAIRNTVNNYGKS